MKRDCSYIKLEYKSLISDNGEYIEKNISRRYLCEGMVERERLGVETNSFREKGLSVEATFRPLMRSIGSRGTKPFIEAHCPSQSSWNVKRSNSLPPRVPGPLQTAPAPNSQIPKFSDDFVSFTRVRYILCNHVAR